jgi:hypothetical protein
MNAIYGAGMDPVPYMVMAYGIGAAGLFGFAAWNLRQRLKLRTLLAAVRKTPGR